MPSLIQLVNYTLAELGRPSVSATTDTPESEYVTAKIFELYKEVLLEYNWSWAIVYINDSSPLSVNFSPDYVYSYALPGDFGKFYKWATTGAQWPIYAFVDGMLLANTLPVQYYYIVNDAAFEVWTPLVSRMLVLYVAAKSAPTLTNNLQLCAYLENEYVKMRTRAILQDDMERSVQTTPYNDFDRITFV
jgi:hypothetical protein